MSTVEPNTTELASLTDIPVETSSAEELSSVMSNWETSSAPTLSIETPVSSHHSSMQHSSFESSADINTVFSSKSAFETASDYIVSMPSLNAHSIVVPQSSVSALSVVSESLASAEPSFVVPSESFIFSASSAAPQPSSSTYSVSFTTQFETPSSAGPHWLLLLNQILNLFHLPFNPVIYKLSSLPLGLLPILMVLLLLNQAS